MYLRSTQELGFSSLKVDNDVCVHLEKLREGAKGLLFVVVLGDDSLLMLL